MAWKTVSTRPIFGLDVEARPGPWGGGDFTFKSMLSLAGIYADSDAPAYLRPGFTAGELEWFVQPLRMDTLIVTHNGPKYDLPFLNGTLIKMGLKPLGTLWISDTYAHLPKRGQAFSASLGNMAKRFDVGVAKGGMGEFEWERAYAGDPDALDRLREYNIQDVRTTLALRKRLLELGLLGPPRRWKP